MKTPLLDTVRIVSRKSAGLLSSTVEGLALGSAAGAASHIAGKPNGGAAVGLGHPIAYGASIGGGIGLAKGLVEALVRRIEARRDDRRDEAMAQNIYNAPGGPEFISSLTNIWQSSDKRADIAGHALDGALIGGLMGYSYGRGTGNQSALPATTSRGALVGGGIGLAYGTVSDIAGHIIARRRSARAADIKERESMDPRNHAWILRREALEQARQQMRG